MKLRPPRVVWYELSSPSFSTIASTPLVAGAATKIVYDVLLWTEFRRLKPPEELG